MKNSMVRSITGLVVVAMLSTMVFAGCKKKEKYRLVKVEAYEGEVGIEREGSDDLEIFEGMQLISQDVISVGDKSNLELLVNSDKHLFADSNTTFELVADGNSKSSNIQINILDGSALIEIDNKLNEDSSFVVTTPNAVFSVRGTQFSVAYNADKETTLIEVIEGVVAAEYTNGTDNEDIAAGSGRYVTSDEVAIVDGETFDIIDAYNEIVCDLDGYIASGALYLNHDYVEAEYLYYDYDYDGRKDLILYLGYVDIVNMGMGRELVYFKYDEDLGKAVCYSTSDGNANYYFTEYNGELVRYCWDASNNMSSYIERVYDDGATINYELLKTFDILYSSADAGLDDIPYYWIGTPITPDM